jgi:hypothetical protein
MRKTVFLMTFSIVLVLAAGSVWADEVTGLNTFVADTPAVAAEVNANFAEVQDSVNDNDSRISVRETVYRTLPEGEVSSFYGRVPIPQSLDTTASTTISIYISGCDGLNVRMGYAIGEIQVGWNGLILLLPAYQNVPMASSMLIGFPLNRASWSISSAAFNTDSILAIYSYRDGTDDVNDTCTSDATLYGVKVDFPLTSGGFQSSWLPPSELQ